MPAKGPKASRVVRDARHKQKKKKAKKTRIEKKRTGKPAESKHWPSGVEAKIGKPLSVQIAIPKATFYCNKCLQETSKEFSGISERNLPRGFVLPTSTCMTGHCHTWVPIAPTSTTVR